MNFEARSITRTLVTRYTLHPLEFSTAVTFEAIATVELRAKGHENGIMSTTTSAAATASCSTGSCVGRRELSEEAINQELKLLSPGVWKLSDDKKKISIRFTTRSWSKAIAFINELSALAESEAISHHPGWVPSLENNSINR
jgi:pterin-4a-carbinolamine dehydratase